MGKYYMKAMYVNLCTAIRPLVILSIDMDCQEECNIYIYIFNSMHQQKCVAAPAARVHYDSSGILGLSGVLGPPQRI
jgi:hypothetical protein